MKNRYLCILALLFLFVCSAGCDMSSPSDLMSDSNISDPPPDVYFNTWLSYHAYTTDDIPILQLTFIEFGERFDIISANEYGGAFFLKNNDYELQITNITRQEGTETSDFTMASLLIKLPPLDEGVHLFDTFVHKVSDDEANMILHKSK